MKVNLGRPACKDCLFHLVYEMGPVVYSFETVVQAKLFFLSNTCGRNNM